MDDRRFAPPAAVVEDLPAPGEVPAGVLGKIRRGWMAGLVSAAFTALAVLGDRTPSAGLEWVDVALILGMSLGIWRRSRACAVAMFVYFVASKILLALNGQVSGLLWGLVFVYLYGQAVSGTFAYRRWLATAGGRR